MLSDDEGVRGDGVSKHVSVVFFVALLELVEVRVKLTVSVTVRDGVPRTVRLPVSWWVMVNRGVTVLLLVLVAVIRGVSVRSSVNVFRDDFVTVASSVRDRDLETWYEAVDVCWIDGLSVGGLCREYVIVGVGRSAAVRVVTAVLVKFVFEALSFWDPVVLFSIENVIVEVENSDAVLLTVTSTLAYKVDVRLNVAADPVEQETVMLLDGRSI